jgi:NADH-quinone oxidoreductase subunit J
MLAAPAGAPSASEAASAGFGTTQGLARVLFREHVVAFELTSLLLLVAVVGAVVLARRERA